MSRESDWLTISRLYELLARRKSINRDVANSAYILTCSTKGGQKEYQKENALVVKKISYLQICKARYKMRIYMRKGIQVKEKIIRSFLKLLHHPCNL